MPTAGATAPDPDPATKEQPVSTDDPNATTHTAEGATSLPAAAEQLLATAMASSARRAGQTLIPGAHAPLKQTLLALGAGASLDEHESPTAATLQVLHGKVRLGAGKAETTLSVGDFAPIPPVRHHLDAIEDAVVLLTAVQLR